MSGEEIHDAVEVRVAFGVLSDRADVGLDVLVEGGEPGARTAGHGEFDSSKRGGNAAAEGLEEIGREFARFAFFFAAAFCTPTARQFA